MHIKRTLFLTVMVLALGVSQPVAQAQDKYVGSKNCAGCHQHEYENFTEYSKKPHSWEHIQKMEPKLTKQEFQRCFDCHTTGHGRGGFVSYEKTPELANVGCETCHGPGGEHVRSGGDPSLIKSDITQKDCKRCHNSERVEDFNFKPLIYGGVH